MTSARVHRAPRKDVLKIAGRRILLFLLLLGPTASAAAGEWQDNFARGMVARDQKEWDAVISYMQRAIHEQPTTDVKPVRIIGSMRYERYLPHYYLGMAFSHKSDCPRALAALDQARRQGKLNPNQKNKIEKVEKQCGRTSPPPPPPPPPSQTTRRRQPPPPPPPLTTRRRQPPSPPVPPPAPPPPAWPAPTPPSPPTPTPPTPPVSSPPVMPPPPTTPPPALPPLSLEDVRKQELVKKAEEVREILRPLPELAEKLSAKTANDPSSSDRIAAAYRELNSVKTLLKAAEREGDLDAMGKAVERARKVRRELEELAQALGVAV